MDNSTKVVNLCSLEGVRDWLAKKVDQLKVLVSQSNNRLKAPDDKNLDNDKKIHELNIAHDEALAQLLSQKEELKHLKSEKYCEKIIANFKKYHACETEV